MMADHRIVLLEPTAWYTLAQIGQQVHAQYLLIRLEFGLRVGLTVSHR